MPTHTYLMNNALASVPTTTGAMDINQPYPPHYFQQKLYPSHQIPLYITIALKAKTSLTATSNTKHSPTT